MSDPRTDDWVNDPTQGWRMPPDDDGLTPEVIAAYCADAGGVLVIDEPRRHFCRFLNCLSSEQGCPCGGAS
jgi:hypothetical protein